MQPLHTAEQPVSMSGSALLYGGILGLIYGIVEVVSRFTVGKPGIGLILGIVSWGSGVIFLLLAGSVVASRGAGLGRATLAGLCASLFAWLIDAVFFVILHLLYSRFYFDQLALAARLSGTHMTPAIARVAYLGQLVVYLLVSLGFGALLGLFGGLIGKTRSKPPVLPYQEAMYTGLGAPPSGSPPASYPSAGYPPAAPPSAAPGEWPQNPPPTSPAQ